MTRSLAVALNALGLYAIALVLAAAFAAQLLLGELPCPLCLLQLRHRREHGAQGEAHPGGN